MCFTCIASSGLKAPPLLVFMDRLPRYIGVVEIRGKMKSATIKRLDEERGPDLFVRDRGWYYQISNCITSLLVSFILVHAPSCTRPLSIPLSLKNSTIVTRQSLAGFLFFGSSRNPIFGGRIFVATMASDLSSLLTSSRALTSHLSRPDLPSVNLSLDQVEAQSRRLVSRQPGTSNDIDRA